MSLKPTLEEAFPLIGSPTSNFEYYQDFIYMKRRKKCSDLEQPHEKKNNLFYFI
jgi:hypothetical protein